MNEERPLASLMRSCAPVWSGDPGVRVGGVAYDSRRVRPGDVFVAIAGLRADGTAFVPEALERGARAVVSERPRPAGLDVAWARVRSARTALACLACAWHDEPSHRLTVAGVTGTNGKTTVTALLESLLATRGPCGRWSTTLVRYGSIEHCTPRTTPEAPELQAALAGMVAAGSWAAAIEVSSHALALERVAGTRFTAAAFTNLSPDHLDFHLDMRRYLDVKARLFEGLAGDAPAAINLSDAHGPELARRSGGRVLGYGWAATSPGAAYAIEELVPAPDGSRIRLRTPDGDLELASRLLGRANAENVVAAVALALELGIGRDQAQQAVAAFTGVPGRLERIDEGQPFDVLVDFAHTPGALEAALDAARSVTAGELVVVFGCGGDRDRAKRPAMGAVAARLADLTIVTSDNPRSEDPEAIIEQILAGASGGDRARVRAETDRARAIGLAIDAARPGDCVLIAGKGHEREQVFADRTVAFDDREVARGAIRAARRHGGLVS